MRVDNLQDCAQGKDEGTDNETGSTTQVGCNGGYEEAAEKGAALKDGDGVRVDGRFLCRGVVAVSEVILK